METTFVEEFGNMKKMLPNRDPLLMAKKLIPHWAHQWGVNLRSFELTIEWSPRLTRSLGRAYPKRKLVRLNRILFQTGFRNLLKEVLCHEIAHVAVFLIHGPKAASHGAEWKQLVTSVGFVARRVIELPGFLYSPSTIQYEHRCSVCHSKRYAKRPQLKWRCVRCREEGLSGKLGIQSFPISRDVS